MGMAFMLVIAAIGIGLHMYRLYSTIYRYMRGNSSKNKKPKIHISRLPDPKNKNKNKKDPDKGEYIDYEEVP